jgi:hypothetical protein
VRWTWRSSVPPPSHKIYPARHSELAEIYYYYVNENRSASFCAGAGRWYTGLSAPPPPGQGTLPKIALLKLKAILATSSVSALAARVDTTAAQAAGGGGGSPADALVGPASLGALCDAFGCASTPSPTRPDPAAASRVEGGSYQPGGYFSVLAHGSVGGASSVDAVQLSVPPHYWRHPPPSLLLPPGPAAVDGPSPVRAPPASELSYAELRVCVACVAPVLCGHLCLSDARPIGSAPPCRWRRRRRRRRHRSACGPLDWPMRWPRSWAPPTVRANVDDNMHIFNTMNILILSLWWRWSWLTSLVV